MLTFAWYLRANTKQRENSNRVRKTVNDFNSTYMTELSSSRQLWRDSRPETPKLWAIWHNSKEYSRNPQFRSIDLIRDEYLQIRQESDCHGTKDMLPSISRQQNPHKSSTPKPLCVVDTKNSTPSILPCVIDTKTSGLVSYQHARDHRYENAMRRPCIMGTNTPCVIDTNAINAFRHGLIPPPCLINTMTPCVVDIIPRRHARVIDAKTPDVIDTVPRLHASSISNTIHWYQNAMTTPYRAMVMPQYAVTDNKSDVFRQDLALRLYIALVLRNWPV